MQPEKYLSTIEIPSAKIPVLGHLFQAGIFMEILTGRSLHDLLISDWKIPPIFLDTHVRTIFWNQKPVDNLKNTQLANEGTLAFSASMPGLFGAIMRKESPLAGMRDLREISPQPLPKKPGIIRVKLFNTLIKRMGPLLLARGILLDQDQYREMAADFPKVAKRVPFVRVCLKV